MRWGGVSRIRNKNKRGKKIFFRNGGKATNNTHQKPTSVRRPFYEKEIAKRKLICKYWTLFRKLQIATLRARKRPRAPYRRPKWNQTTTFSGPVHPPQSSGGVLTGTPLTGNGTGSGRKMTPAHPLKAGQHVGLLSFFLLNAQRFSIHSVQ